MPSFASIQPAPNSDAEDVEAVEDFKTQINDNLKSIEYDEETKTLRIPTAAVDVARRSKLVSFTCNLCGGRTSRLVNPIAWEKGLVMAQCAKCKVWHVLSAPNKKIFEEVRYKQKDDNPTGSSEE